MRVEVEGRLTEQLREFRIAEKDRLEHVVEHMLLNQARWDLLER